MIIHQLKCVSLAMKNLTPSQKTWIEHHCSIEHISDIAGDAGFRHYYRIHSSNKSYIFVDASLEPPIFQAYIQQTQHLSAYDLPIPALIAVEEKKSWALLEDFGETLLIDHPERERFYPQAMDHLITFHACPIQAYGRFKALDTDLMDEEFRGFQQWYLQDLTKRFFDSQEQQAFNACLDIIKEAVREQPVVFMHRDYHSRNLLCINDKLGIIDFQDAMAGPITYDLVSLLRDCYIHWPTEFSEKMALYYKNKSPLLTQVSDEQFLRWFDLTSIQRHLKALFTFARKALRDHQPEYLAHAPRTWCYIQQVSEKYPELDFICKLAGGAGK